MGCPSRWSRWHSFVGAAWSLLRVLVPTFCRRLWEVEWYVTQHAGSPEGKSWNQTGILMQPSETPMGRRSSFLSLQLYCFLSLLNCEQLLCNFCVWFPWLQLDRFCCRSNQSLFHCWRSPVSCYVRVAWLLLLTLLSSLSPSQLTSFFSPAAPAISPLIYCASWGRHQLSRASYVQGSDDILHTLSP